MNQKMILISIKPEFVEKILSGEKTIELRKSKPDAATGDLIILYSTAPVKAIVGFCVIDNIIVGKPGVFWDKHHADCGIDKMRFFEYYENYNKVIGIKLKEIYRLPKKINLQTVRSNWPRFSPPQTYKYLSKSEVLRWYSEQLMS